jgi:hypothetical protein
MCKRRNVLVKRDKCVTGDILKRQNEWNKGKILSKKKNTWNTGLGMAELKGYPTCLEKKGEGHSGKGELYGFQT